MSFKILLALGGAAVLAAGAAVLEAVLLGEERRREETRQRERYTEEEAAEIAQQEEGRTVLLTNEDKLYISNPTQHAEAVMIGSVTAGNISTIWIKNSPCASCSERLIAFFRNQRNKPTIYVGRIWQPYDENDRQGLVKLVQQGFSIEVWERLHHMMYGARNRMTYNHLRNVKEEAHLQEQQRQLRYNQQRNEECIVM